MTEEMMIKTCVQFFGDGYETASQVMGVLTFYLAAYPDVQEKLQDEIDELFDSKDDGEELQAEDLTGMKYLDQVLKEGQRLGCFGMTARTCTKNWQIPGETFVIPKNTRVVIPIVCTMIQNTGLNQQNLIQKDLVMKTRGKLSLSHFKFLEVDLGNAWGKIYSMLKQKFCCVIC